jgi:hypothetical protein
MHAVQEKKLHHQEKQEKRSGQDRVEKVLPLVPDAYPAPGNPLMPGV